MIAKVNPKHSMYVVTTGTNKYCYFEFLIRDFVMPVQFKLQDCKFNTQCNVPLQAPSAR